MCFANMVAALKGWRARAITTIIATVSVLGVTFLLPWQEKIYLAIGYTVHAFLDKRGDRQAYIQLSQDESVTGVVDLTNHWSISGGYFYLHKEVPLYDRSLFQAHIQDKPLIDYASHMITTADVENVAGFSRSTTYKSKNTSDVVLWTRKENNGAQYYWDSYILNQ
ncbi:hypothetical protein ACFL1S_08820 [Pseudomonadota bacterium]